MEVKKVQGVIEVLSCPPQKGLQTKIPPIDCQLTSHDNINILKSMNPMLLWFKAIFCEM